MASVRTKDFTIIFELVEKKAITNSKEPKSERVMRSDWVIKKEVEEENYYIWNEQKK